MSRATSYRPKLFIVFAALLVGAWTSASAQAQEFVFVVARSATDPNAYWIWSAECKNLNVKASKQDKVVCDLTLPQCKPGACKFETRSDDKPPLPLVFGISSYNPTCGWVWDPYKKAYVYRC